MTEQLNPPQQHVPKIAVPVGQLFQSEAWGILLEVAFNQLAEVNTKLNALVNENKELKEDIKDLKIKLMDDKE